jgi:glycosyltransferase involved in cell wall biosynthesis
MANADQPAPEISIIVPVYNEAAVIASVLERVRKVMDDTAKIYEILVVDDGSCDGSAAKVLPPARVISHPYNIGNGSAVKTGIRNSRGMHLLLIDGDGQHAPEDIPRILDKLDTFDMVVGARTRDSARETYRVMANRIYNFFASYICGRRIEDLTSGFRGMKGNIARRFVYLLPNRFSYPTTLTLAVVRSGHSLTYVPVRTHHRIGKSKIRIIKDGARFFIIILRIATLFSPLKVFLPVSFLMFLVGLSYGIFRIAAMDAGYGPTSAMLMIMAVVVFMVGLVSEQVAQLRFDRSEDIDVDRQ